MRKLVLVTAIFLACFKPANAEEQTTKHCFSITTPPMVAGGQSVVGMFGLNAMNGSILINSCTGQTWFLAKASAAKGAYTYRWYPILTGTEEATYAEPKASQ